MRDLKFTKGPWKLYGDWGIQQESAKGDEKIFAQFSHDAECENTEEGFANAFLIQAAPDMLEALRLLAAGGDPVRQRQNKALQAARARSVLSHWVRYFEDFLDAE